MRRQYRLDLPDRQPVRTITPKGTLLFGADDVPEIQSLGRTLRKWRTEILNHHRTGASNGPTEGMNLCIKKVKRSGHGYRCFDLYRLPVLLQTQGCNWDRYTTRPAPIRTRCSPLKSEEPISPTRPPRVAFSFGGVDRISVLLTILG
jgi:hypothetical protein